MSKEFCEYLPSVRRRRRRRRKKEDGVPFLSIRAPTTTIKIEEKEKTVKTDTVKKRLVINVKEYDVITIDMKIRDKLSQNISSVEELQGDLSKVLWIVSNGQISQKTKARRNANLLRKRINDLSNTMELGLYILKTSDIIDEYKHILQNEGAEDFVKTSTSFSDPNIKRKRELEDIFYSIAKEYVDLTNVPNRSQKMACPACKGSNFISLMDDDSTYICSDCQTELNLFDESPSFKDASRINLSNRYTYTKEGHFEDAKRRFQGLQNIDPDKLKVVVATLQEEMKKHGLTAERGRPNSVTKDNLYDFLTDQKHLSNHYGDINLINYIITGEPCPNIGHLNDYLDDDFKKFEEAYKELKDPDRINSLNVDYKLCRFLQRRKFPCRLDDFYVLKTKTKEDEHDEKSKEVFEYLDWEWPE
jgi:transposase-like protein